MQFPQMATVKQLFSTDVVDDPIAAVKEQLQQAGLNSHINPGARIAVSSGSRGIANIPAISRTVVDCIKEAGGHPFILPAMGSHGGASPEGQKEVLASYGITEESMGVPVEATMDVVQVDQLEDGTPVLLNRLALEADGVVLINRIKPHTSFRGTFESGLMKMMTIGLGSHKGATMAHAQGAQGLARLIPAWGKVILDKAPIAMGLAIIENAYDQTARVIALRPEEFEHEEPKLLEDARAAMPRILVQGIDLLIVDQIGKDISGTCMDTNIIGRMMLPGVKEPDEPGVARIFVRRLSDTTHGNANGVGLSDVITKQLFDSIDFEATYANAFTSTFLNRAYIPIIKADDREAIASMFEVLRIDDGATARVARIINTIDVEHIQLSESLARTSDHPDLTQVGEFGDMCFDADGALV